MAEIARQRARAAKDPRQIRMAWLSPKARPWDKKRRDAVTKPKEGYSNYGGGPMILALAVKEMTTDKTWLLNCLKNRGKIPSESSFKQWMRVIRIVVKAMRSYGYFRVEKVKAISLEEKGPHHDSMVAIKRNCRLAGIEPPVEVKEYFDRRVGDMAITYPMIEMEDEDGNIRIALKRIPEEYTHLVLQKK